MQKLKIQQKININLPLKILEYHKLQRELNQLKSKIQTKISLFDQSQYHKISDRINSCQKYFKIQKQQLIREETNNTLNKNNSRKSQARRLQQRNQQLLRQRKYHSSNKNENILDHSKIKAINEQRECLQIKNKVKYKDYSKQIVNKKCYAKCNCRVSKQINSQASKNERYISSFEQKIKQSLSKITQLNFNYQSQSQLQRNLITQNRSIELEDDIQKKYPFRKQQRKEKYYSNKKNIKDQEDRKEKEHLNRFNQLQQRVYRCKTELKERYCQNIKKLSREKFNYYQKSERLDYLYQQFNQKQKNGSPQALDLMCMVTLAKADILLQKI